MLTIFESPKNCAENLEGCVIINTRIRIIRETPATTNILSSFGDLCCQYFTWKTGTICLL